MQIRIREAPRLLTLLVNTNNITGVQQMWLLRERERASESESERVRDTCWIFSLYTVTDDNLILGDFFLYLLTLSTAQILPPTPMEAKLMASRFPPSTQQTLLFDHIYWPPLITPYSCISSIILTTPDHTITLLTFQRWRPFDPLPLSPLARKSPTTSIPRQEKKKSDGLPFTVYYNILALMKETSPHLLVTAIVNDRAGDIPTWTLCITSWKFDVTSLITPRWHLTLRISLPAVTDFFFVLSAYKPCQLYTISAFYHVLKLLK